MRAVAVGLALALAAGGWRHLTSADGGLPPANGGTQQTACQVFDIDGDGVNDIVLAERTQSPSVVWLRRTGDGWRRYVLDDSRLRIEAGGEHADLDGDGDLDLIFGGDSGSAEVWWWENPRPRDPTRPWTRRLIKRDGGRKHHDQLLGDFDGDGRLELVTWNQGARSLLWCPVPADPKVEPWPLEPIYRYEGREHEGLAAADLDGDGVDDIIGGGRWYKHVGQGRFEASVIDAAQTFTRAVAGQFVEGGRPEVAFCVGDGVGALMFYECAGDPSQAGSWRGRRLLPQEIDHGHSLRAGDVDGDGRLDLFLGEMNLDGKNPTAKGWLLLGDGRGNFRETVLTDGLDHHESRLADLDGDGDLDLLHKPYNWNTPRIDVWLNPGGRVVTDRTDR